MQCLVKGQIVVLFERVFWRTEENQKEIRGQGVSLGIGAIVNKISPLTAQTWRSVTPLQIKKTLVQKWWYFCVSVIPCVQPSSCCVDSTERVVLERISYHDILGNKWCFVLKIVQRDATQSSLFIILQVHSICFGCQPHPSSGVHKTVTTAKLAWPRWREVAAQKIWPVPVAVITVLFTPDEGCGWHPKHIEWTCRIINRLLCFASRWTIINIDQRCTEP